MCVNVNTVPGNAARIEAARVDTVRVKAARVDAGSGLDFSGGAGCGFAHVCADRRRLDEFRRLSEARRFGE